jgi:8-oxo-dGTP diphosphatase
MYPASKEFPVQTTNPDEIPFLAAYDASRYPRPSVTVDVVLLTVRDESLRVLLGRRPDPPERDRWALPGGFVGVDEALDAAAERVLREKAGLRDVFTEQLFTFGTPDRDPRTRVISVAYYALVEPHRLDAAVRSFASERLCVARVEADDAPGPAAAFDDEGARLALAFDHVEIIATAVRRVRGKLDYARIGFELLPRAFSLRDLRLVHEAILGRPLNKDSFRRKMLDRGLVAPTGRRASSVGHQPPELYAFAGGSGP